MEHIFEPKNYHTLMGSLEPCLRVRDGDTILTRTVDASGADEKRTRVADSGNPQTGPFFVEGAEPGDTLAVRFDQLSPNRTYGYTRIGVSPNVVDPDYVRTLPDLRTDQYAEWRLDLEKRTVALLSPRTKLTRLVLPFQPMLGCFGVSPKRCQMLSTLTAAEHGGNMDYRGFTEGTTAYLPVFVEGALLFLGDGHAVQGDGEIVGNGVEVSMNVKVTVRVLKGQSITWPRGESNRHIFTVGNARPLDQALQHATTEMLRWLQSSFGLDPQGAALLLGQCVQYDVGNFYDPAYTMVCKLDKLTLNYALSSSYTICDEL